MRLEDKISLFARDNSLNLLYSVIGLGYGFSMTRVTSREIPEYTKVIIGVAMGNLLRYLTKSSTINLFKAELPIEPRSNTKENAIFFNAFMFVGYGLNKAKDYFG